MNKKLKIYSHRAVIHCSMGVYWGKMGQDIHLEQLLNPLKKKFWTIRTGITTDKSYWKYSIYIYYPYKTRKLLTSYAWNWNLKLPSNLFTIQLFEVLTSANTIKNAEIRFVFVDLISYLSWVLKQLKQQKQCLNKTCRVNFSIFEQIIFGLQQESSKTLVKEGKILL